MNLDWNKIRYSKCPNCKKHSIPAFSKISGKGVRSRISTPSIVECENCKKQYIANGFLVFLIQMITWILAIVLCWLLHFPIWAGIILPILLLLAFEYFLPLKEFMPYDEYDA